MRKKRFLSVVLAAAMVMGSTVAASAASIELDETQKGVAQSVSGQGYFNGIVSANVFKVVVPAQRTDTLDVFDFILDPQELITSTNAAKYVSGNTVGGKNVSINSAADFDPGSLYFVNSSNGTKRLSNTSDSYVITNKSTMDVDVSVNAQLTAGSGVKIATDSTFAGDEDTSMYMGMLVGSETAVRTISTGNAKLATGTIGNAKEYYRVSENTDGTYRYEIPSANESANAYKTFEFKLTGSCNTAVDWSDVDTTTAPSVQVTYYLNEHVDPVAPSVATTSYQMSAGQNIVVDVDLGVAAGAATRVANVLVRKSAGDSDLPTSHWSYANGKVTIASAYVDETLGLNVDRNLVIVFDDPDETEVLITLKK